MSLKRFQYNTVGKSFQICIKNHIVLGEHSSAVYIQHHNSHWWLNADAIYASKKSENCLHIRHSKENIYTTRTQHAVIGQIGPNYITTYAQCTFSTTSTKHKKGRWRCSVTVTILVTSPDGGYYQSCHNHLPAFDLPCWPWPCWAWCKA